MEGDQERTNEILTKEVDNDVNLLPDIYRRYYILNLGPLLRRRQRQPGRHLDSRTSHQTKWDTYILVMVSCHIVLLGRRRFAL